MVVGDHAVGKPGELVDAEAPVRLKGEPMPYVSRGGLKLVHALDHFAIDVRGLRALDVGASTGGFTDVLLQRGAAAVIARRRRLRPARARAAQRSARHRARADQRAHARRRHPALASRPRGVRRVVHLAHARPAALVAAAGPGRKPIVALVKPQFEVGKGEVGKGGVVRDPTKRRAAVDKCAAAARALGCEVVGVVESPITGPAGNVEYLLFVRTAPI